MGLISGDRDEARNTERVTGRLVCDFGHGVRVVLGKQTLRCKNTEMGIRCYYRSPEARDTIYRRIAIIMGTTGSRQRETDKSNLTQQEHV